MADISGSFRSETYEGTDEEDLFIASAGVDRFVGWYGVDAAFYESGPFPSGVFVNNTAVAIDGVAAFTTDKRGAGFDTLISIEAFHGTNLADVIHVGPLTDYVLDRGGDDLITVVQSPEARPVFFGVGSGDDQIVGSINIGDTVSYYDVFRRDIKGNTDLGVNADLATGTVRDPWGDTDILSGIEHLWGTTRADRLVGGQGYNLLRGRDGDDRIVGGAGDDDLDGGPGDDTLDGGEGAADEADYSRDEAAIFADLASGRVRDGFGGTDTLIRIESVRGSAFDDTIHGGDAGEWLRGDAGNDLLSGGGGDDLLQGGPGNDTLDGGAGSADKALFEGARRGVEADLTEGYVDDGLGGRDVLIGIEQILATGHDDTLRGGGDRSNQLDGGAGNDLLVAGGGDVAAKNDLIGGEGHDTLVGGTAGFTYFEPGPGNDRIEGVVSGAVYNELSYAFDGPARDAEAAQGILVNYGTALDGRVIDYSGRTDLFFGIDRILGTMRDDVFNGSAATQTFTGFAGDDAFNGGQGAVDRVDYSKEAPANDATRGIVLDLGTGRARDAYGDTDRLTGIESVLGTAFADAMTGGAGDETLDGAEGDDTLEGSGGDDFLRGGAGSDLARFDAAGGAHVITIYGADGTVDVVGKDVDGSGHDTLDGVERLRFGDGYSLDGGGDGDGTLALTQLTGAAGLGPGQVARFIEMYVAYFDRAPDALGLLYWGTRLADGMSLRAIAESFFAQDEARALLPAAGEAAALVDVAYANVLERGPDEAGRAFWIAELESGAVSRGAFMLALIDGARGEQAAPEDIAVIGDKAQIGWRYAVEYGLTDPGRASEAMAAYDPRAADPAVSLDAAEGLMAQFRDAAVDAQSTELVIRIGDFGGDPLAM